MKDPRQEEDNVLARVGVQWGGERVNSEGVPVRRAEWATVRGRISERQIRKLQEVVGRDVPVAWTQEFQVD